MIIGLIILGIVSLLFLFGLLKSVLIRTQIPYWAMFIILASFTISAFLPSIKIGVVLVSPSTFLLPLILSIVFFIKAIYAQETLPFFLTCIISSTVVVAFELLLFGQGAISDVFASVFLGVIVGAIAFVITPSAVSALSGILGGFVLGQAVTGFVNYTNNAQNFIFGSQNLFSGIIIALTCALAVGVAFSKMSTKVGESIVKRSNYMSEQSEETYDDAVFYDDFFRQ